MNLVPNWKAILTKAYSTYVMGSSAAALVLTEVVPYLDDILPKWAIVILLLAGIGLRLVEQPGLKSAPTDDPKYDDAV